MIDINVLFHDTGIGWMVSRRYIFLRGPEGIEYLTEAPDDVVGARPRTINSWEDVIIKAVNVGLLCLAGKSDRIIHEAILKFVSEYGLLGFMSALPTAPDYMSDEKVYLPTNGFIKEKCMNTEDYLRLFFPFGLPRGVEIEEKENRKPGGSPFVFMREFNRRKASEQPEGFLMHQTGYAERFDWLVAQFKDWAFVLTASQLYEENLNRLETMERVLIQKGISAYHGVTPTYHLKLDQKLSLTWNFNSLMQSIQMIYYLMFMDQDLQIRICKHCGRAYLLRDGSGRYCCENCRIRSQL